MALPQQLKSGRQLVATAGDGSVGLYWGGSDDPADWRIVLPNKTVARGTIGSRGRPLAPDGRWNWLPGKKPGKPRARKHVEGTSKKQPQLDALRENHRAPEQKELPVSATQLCIDCDTDLRQKKHSHTLREAGLPASICCKCARARGLSCIIYDRAMRRKKRLRRRS